MPRSTRQNAFQLFGRRIDIELLYEGKFIDQPFQRRFVHLAFAIRLFRLSGRAIEIANDFGDRDRIAAVDLRFIFLSPAALHCPF